MEKIYPAAIIVSLLFIIMYVMLALSGVVFIHEAGETIGAISGWCERVSGGIFREPSNTLSNIGFMLAGLLMLKVLFPLQFFYPLQMFDRIGILYTD